MISLTDHPKRWYSFTVTSLFNGTTVSGPYKTRREAREMRRFLEGGHATCGPVVMYKRAGVVR